MPRSSYIYLMVTRTGLVLGAFTVKRELIEVGRRLDAERHDRSPDRIWVHRYEDGMRGAGRNPVVMGTLREVIDGHA